MNIRTAIAEDLDLLMSLVERLEAELPSLPYAEDPPELERRKVERMVNEGVALVAEEDGSAVGYLLARYGDHGPTTVYVSDLWVDAPARRRGVGRELLPRLVRGASMQVEPGRGWTVVRMDPFGAEVLRKLGVELSYRFGVTVLLSLEDDAVVRFVIHDSGRMVDEYLSVPEYFGPLPPGDALGLRANPTVVSRLTGAAPARVRAVARNAERPGDLPPAGELYAQVADVLGLQP